MSFIRNIRYIFFTNDKQIKYYVIEMNSKVFIVLNPKFKIHERIKLCGKTLISLLSLMKL
jgi:hypothetical protein